MNVTLCLMVFNELEGLKSDVPNLPLTSFEHIFAIDGGSTDGTVQYLIEHGIPVFKQPKPSLNAAYNYAVEICKSEGLVVFFPKGTLDPHYCEDLAYHLKNGCQLVIASRNIPGGVNEEDKHLFKPRKWGVMMLSHFVSLLWRKEGPIIYDVLHGIKGFTVTGYHNMNISEAGVTIDLEMVIRAYKLKLSRLEIPVVEKSRIAGKTNFPLFKTAKKLAIFLCSEIFSPRR